MIVFSVGLTQPNALRFDNKMYTLSRKPVSSSSNSSSLLFAFFCGEASKARASGSQQQHIFHFEKQLKRTWSVFENKHIYTMVSQKNFCDVFDAQFFQRSPSLFLSGCWLFLFGCTVVISFTSIFHSLAHTNRILCLVLLLARLKSIMVCVLWKVKSEEWGKPKKIEMINFYLVKNAWHGDGTSSK